MTDTTTPAAVQFSDLRLDPKVLQAVAEAGYTQPTPIQAGAIPPALEGRDVLGIAQTGTGKTASFVLPMITLLGRGRARARMPRSLVLCPTRELAAQVAENFDTYAKHTRLTKALLIGGVSMKDQERLIASGVDVLIATPGRLLDHFERGNLLLQGVQVMVVDEADRMLDMGFIPDIERIFQLTPFTRQTLFFSATMAPEIERITNTFLNAPARVEVARQATASETITQRLVQITPTRKDQSAKQKRALLRALINAEGDALKNAIIFCNRKTEVDVVSKSLKSHGYDAAPIHGDLDQSQRTRTLEGFREGALRFLIASDVAARGLDIPAVSHVFNFDLPSHPEDYVHRIGRTGRAGREGTAISLGVPADDKYLTAIENLLKRSLPRAPLPEGFVPGEESREARPARDESRAGASSRGRSRRGKGEARPAAVAAAEAAPAPAPAPAPVQDEAPRREEPRREEPRREEPRREDRGREDRSRNEPRRDESRREERSRDESRRDDRRHDDSRRDDRNRDDRRREDRRREDRNGDEPRRDNGERPRGPAVAGFGDHLPDFMTRLFKVGFREAPEPRERPAPRPSAPAKPASPEPAAPQKAADAEATVIVAAAPGATTPEAEAAPKARRSRKPAAKKGDAPKEAGAPEADAPKRVSRTRTRRKPATDAEAAAPEAAQPASPGPEAAPGLLAPPSRDEAPSPLLPVPQPPADRDA